MIACIQGVELCASLCSAVFGVGVAVLSAGSSVGKTDASWLAEIAYEAGVVFVIVLE